MTLSPLAYTREAERLAMLAKRAATVADCGFGDSAELARRQAARFQRQACRLQAQACQLMGRQS